jgi:tRNA pseudouridine55 synthase
MFGFLTVNKPKGLTSRATLDVIERLVRPLKVGHCGTLDPLASGVLVICLGPATRLVRFVQQMPKLYIGDFRLGWESDTEDIAGTLQPVENQSPITSTDLSGLLPEFVGRIRQQPPRFSALRIQGKRAYELARQGADFELQSRWVDIYQLRLLNFAYPDFRLEILCGSGTYVRSLGRDIGRRLGSAAIMTDLSRTAIGNFRLRQSLDWSDLQRMTAAEDLLPHLIGPRDGLSYPTQRVTVELNPAQIEDLGFGRRIELSRDPAESLRVESKPGELDRWREHSEHSECPECPECSECSEWLAVDERGNLLAIMQPEASGQHKIAISFLHYWNRQ